MNIWRKRITESVSDGGDCRTAPVTPGLLKIKLHSPLKTITRHASEAHYRLHVCLLKPDAVLKEAKLLGSGISHLEGILKLRKLSSSLHVIKDSF